jgi:hypothetical protein
MNPSLSLAVPAAVFVTLFIGLVWSVASLVRSNSRDLLASAPMVPQQEISLPSTGDVLVMMEVPRMGSDFRTFQIELVQKQTGQATAMSYSYVTAQGATYGFSTMQVPFGRMPSARAGVYLVRIARLQPGKDYSNHRLILSRPYVARMVRQILAIVFCGVGMLLSVIWAASLAGLLTQHG